MQNVTIRPAGSELNSLNNGSNITCESSPVKGWPKTWPDSAKTHEIILSPPADLVDVIKAWSDMPEHVKQTIRTLVTVTAKEKQK